MENQSSENLQSSNCKPSVAKTMRHELVHFVAAIVLAYLFYFYFENLYLGLWTFAVCMFLDADHLFDYSLYLLKHRQSFNLKEFLSGSYFAKSKKFIVPLHSWELALILAVLYFIFNYPIFISSSVALVVHYFVDYFTNDVNKKAYFIFYRFKYGFYKPAIAKNFNPNEELTKS